MTFRTGDCFAVRFPPLPGPAEFRFRLLQARPSRSYSRIRRPPAMAGRRRVHRTRPMPSHSAMWHRIRCRPGPYRSDKVALPGKGFRSSCHRKPQNRISIASTRSQRFGRTTSCWIGVKLPSGLIRPIGTTPECRTDRTRPAFVWGTHAKATETLDLIPRDHDTSIGGNSRWSDVRWFHRG